MVTKEILPIFIFKKLREVFMKMLIHLSSFLVSFLNFRKVEGRLMNENNTEHNSFLMCQNNVKFIFISPKQLNIIIIKVVLF